MGCTWKVISQRQVTGPKPDGTWGPMWQVGYETSDGVKGTAMFTPTEHADPEIVAKRIGMACSSIDSISGLSG